MKKLRGSLWAKTFAIILLALLALTCAASVIAAWWLDEAGAYSRGWDHAAESLVRSRAQEYAENAGLNYLESGTTGVYDDTNFRYALLDARDNTLLFSNWQSEAAWESSLRVTVPHDVSVEYGEDTFDGGEAVHDGPEVRVTPTPRPADGEKVYVLTDFFTGESTRFSAL